MSANKSAIMSDENLLDSIVKQAGYENAIDRVAYSLDISIEKVCETLVNNNIFHLYPRQIMRYLHKNGVSHFDLVAKYGFDLAVLSQAFFQYEPEHYHGKTVNYLKILSHVVENKKTYFICECLACGSVGYKIIKHRATNGLAKSCGCLPRGKRIPDKLPIKNETLQTELRELTDLLVQKGVLFNVESKILNKIAKGETSAEKIAIELNCELDYVYKVARKHGCSEQVNEYSITKRQAANKEKVRKILSAVKHGNAGTLCAEYNISPDTYRKYRKIIENEKRSSCAV